MRYVKFTNFKYKDTPSEQTMYFGQDNTGYFIHQLIQDPQLTEKDGLEASVEATNASTVAFAAESGFDVSFGESEKISICGHDYLVCRQDMKLSDGRRAVQENAYFFDPVDGIFRMVQFGTVAIPTEIYEQNSENFEKYVHRMIRRIIADMDLPDGVFRAPAMSFTIKYDVPTE